MHYSSEFPFERSPGSYIVRLLSRRHFNDDLLPLLSFLITRSFDIVVTRHSRHIIRERRRGQNPFRIDRACWRTLEEFISAVFDLKHKIYFRHLILYKYLYFRGTILCARVLASECICAIQIKELEKYNA